MAINILLIPAISNKPERVFLGACCIISWERIQLRVENIKKVKCSKNWL